MGKLLAALLVLGLVVVVVATWRVRGAEPEEEQRARVVANAAQAVTEEPLIEPAQGICEPTEVAAREDLSVAADSRVQSSVSTTVPPSSSSAHGDVFGRVVLADGTAVADALVLLEGLEPWRSSLAPLARTRTDANGRFSFVEAGAGPFRLEARESSREVVSSAALEPVVPEIEEHLLVLRSCQIYGLIVDEQSRPVPRFQVVWTLLDSEQPPVRAKGDRGEGRFQVSLSPGRWSYRASLPRSGVSARGEVEVPRIEPLVIVLPRAAKVEGRVFDGTGAPARRALVSACTPTNDVSFEDTRTKADGSFRLELPAHDAFRLRAQGAHGEQSPGISLSILPGETRTGIELALPALARLTGQLVSPAGDLSGRTVQFSKDGVVSSGFPTTTTDDGGRFALDVSPGNLMVTLELGDADIALLKERGSMGARSTFSRKVELQPGDVRHLEFHIDSPVRVHGNVTIDGRPADEGHIRAFTDNAGQCREIAQIEVGRYELTLLTSGSCELLFNGDAWGVARVRLDVPPVAEFRHDVKLVSGAIGGEVRDAAGNPLEGITVDAMDFEGEERGDGRAVTDARGGYRIPLVTGTYRVSPRVDFEDERSFREPESQHVEVAAGQEARADFELESAATLEGIVRRADGGALEGGVVGLRDGKDEVRDSFGPEGRFHLTFEGSRGTLSAYGILGADHFVTFEPVELELLPSRVRTLEIVLVRACLVRVHLPGEDSMFSRVEALDERGRSLRFEHDRSQPGAVCEALLFPGTYRLRAHDGPMHERSEEPCASMVVRELVVGPLDRALEVQVVFD